MTRRVHYDEETGSRLVFLAMGIQEAIMKSKDCVSVSGILRLGVLTLINFGCGRGTNSLTTHLIASSAVIVSIDLCGQLGARS
jgi:hypothetical protein